MSKIKTKIQRHKRMRLDASWFLLENPDHPARAQAEEFIAVETVIIAHLKRVHKGEVQEKKQKYPSF